MTTTDDFVKRAEAVGVHVTAQLQQQLDKYQRLLLQWSKVINLTAVQTPSEISTVHFLDSFVLVGWLDTLSHRAPIRSILDVGSGAGFPGVVCALSRPDWNVTVVERIHKKTAFLLSLRRELGLSYEVQTRDIKQLKGEFDVVVSRAVFPPEEWLNVAPPFVKPGGFLVAMLGPRVPVLPAPTDFVEAGEKRYDVGAGPRLLRAWQRKSAF